MQNFIMDQRRSIFDRWTTFQIVIEIVSVFDGTSVRCLCVSGVVYESADRKLLCVNGMEWGDVYDCLTTTKHYIAWFTSFRGVYDHDHVIAMIN